MVSKVPLKNILIRPAHIHDCPAIGRILVDATASALEGLVPEQCLAWTAEQSAANWTRSFQDDGTLQDDDCIFVAESETDGVIGFAMVGEARPTETADHPIDKEYTHELLSIHVDPVWQQKGIGRLLVARAAEELYNQGITHLLVGVLTENPNYVFYQRLGAVQLASKPHDWEGYKTRVILYGWDNIDRLK